MIATLNRPLIGMPTKGNIQLFSGDELKVAYTDPNGKKHTINITAQHLVLMVAHEESNSAMVCRPAVGVQFVRETE